MKEEKNDLHPSLNQIIVARKPFKGSLVDNVIKYGVGGINIDECRVSMSQEDYIMNTKKASKEFIGVKPFGNVDGKGSALMPNEKGRFPANTILTYDQITFDEVCGGFPYTKGEIGRAGRKSGGNYNASSYKVGVVTDYSFKDSGSAARYFYCAKASRKDRDEGLEDKNTHCCVKPTTLMQYLVRLVSPKGATILDPFMGSGSTGKAIMYENKERNANYKFIGIEQNEEYCKIAKARIEGVNNEKQESSNKD